MFQNIRFRDCVHRNIAGATPEAILAVVTGEANDLCAPLTPPAEAGNVFIGVAQVLGEDAFRALWTSFQPQTGGPGVWRKPNPMDFPPYLSGHPMAQTVPQLPDLAAFDLAYFLAAQPSPTPSIGACCLTEVLAREHPELMLRFQPGWRYLTLQWPVHHLLVSGATQDALRDLPAGTMTRLRIAPGAPGVALTEMTPAAYALEARLRNGARLSEAASGAAAIDSSFDPYRCVAGLVEAGAIIDAILHPAMPSPLPALERSRS